MNNHQETIEQFDIELDAEISECSGEKSETFIPEDSPLYQEYLQHKLMVSSIRYAARKDLLATVKAWDGEMTSVPKAHRITLRPVWYYAAASLAILLTFSWLWIRYSESNSLLASHYQPYGYISETTRGAAGDSNDSNIEKAYMQGDYLKVIEEVNSIDVASRTLKIDFLYANACQATGSVKLAIPVFEQIIRADSPYVVASRWYLALCYVSEKDAKKAIPLLKTVQASKSSYSPKAAALLADLEK